MNEIIISEEDFLKSFGEKQFFRVKKYFEAKKLAKTINNYSKIARIIDCPKNTVNYWLKDKKPKPNPVNAFEILKRNKLMPLILDYKNPNFVLFVKVMAFCFGDGHLRKDLESINLFGQKKDLKEIQNQNNALFNFKTKIEKDKTVGKIKKIRKGVIYENISSGTCFRLRIYSAALTKLLFLAGAPKGDKVSSKMQIPSWLIRSPKEIKTLFLGVLFGNEMSCPSLRAKNAFGGAQFGMHKVEELKSNAESFFKQIKSMLKEFGIETTEIKWEKMTKTIRKDNSVSAKIYFNIKSTPGNILKLYRFIPFIYAKEKQKKFNKIVSKFLGSYDVLKKEWQIYDRVLELKNKEIGRRKIFKALVLPANYFYKINAWLYYGNKPTYYDERKIIENAYLNITKSANE